MIDADDWAGYGIDPDQVDSWRNAGFSSEQAGGWSAMLDGLYERSEFTDGVMVRVASAWTVAGFTVDEAAKWIDGLAWTALADCPAVAREWLSAGVVPEMACVWEERERPDIAVHYQQHGWRPWHRDLLLALLDPGTAREMAAETVPYRADTAALRRYLVESGIPAGHVLDYVKAGVPIVDLDAYERMRTFGGKIDGLLEDLADRLERPYGYAYRADQITVGRRQAFHLWPIVDGEPDPFDVEHVPVPPLPCDWSCPVVLRLWADQGEPATRIDTDEWVAGTSWGVEAYPPILSWSDADHGTVEAAFRKGLTPEQECTVEWPPVATLRANGRVEGPPAVPCESHEDFAAWCWTCEAPTEPPTVAPAEFQWYVEVVVRGLDGNGVVLTQDSEVHHIASTFLDPRSVEYREIARLS
ncbi:hypothetical protein ACVW00_000636 [Marmoricola sp. URHA0025 HA25]